MTMLTVAVPGQFDDAEPEEECDHALAEPLQSSAPPSGPT